MSPTIFSSLENINVLFNNLIINSNNDALSLKLISKLVNDLTELLKSATNFYDVEIKTGGGKNSKTFKAHSTILRARSPYFKTALSNNWIKKSEDGVILFEKENISSKVFEVLLKYMYNGVIDIDNMSPSEIVKLLEACDELNFSELIDDLQIHLITKEKKWIQKNLIYINQISLKHQVSFSILQEHSKEIICNKPEIFLKSNNIALIKKSIFMDVLEKDKLKLDEIDIWDCAIKWGVGQNNEFSRKNISEWSREDFNALKNTLSDIIPLIRFTQVTKEDFYNKIKPYKKVFNKDVYEELLQYYILDTWQPRFLLQKGPRTGKGKLLNLEMKSLISSWIDEKK